MKLAFALLVAIGIAAASPARAWDLIGQRAVGETASEDTILVFGDRHYKKLRICVYRETVRFYDVDVTFSDGAQVEVPIDPHIHPGACTRNIEFEGGAQEIKAISFHYEEMSREPIGALVRVFAE